jgi:hypothetical protein
VQGSVTVTLQDIDSAAQLHYTLDGSLPTEASTLYTSPITLTSSSVLTAKAFEPGFSDSVAASVTFVVSAPAELEAANYSADGKFHATLQGLAGKTYLFQTTTNWLEWTTLSTNLATADLIQLVDPSASNYPFQFYRVLQLTLP